MKKQIQITESQINEMVDNAIRLFIREEIDMGQIKSAQEKEEEADERKKNAEERKEYEREARRLRNEIEKAENDGYTEEADRLRDELKKLKQDNGIRTVNESFKSEKLKNFAKQHGGLKNGKDSIDFINDLYNMSDEDFDDYVVTTPEEYYQKNGINGASKEEYTNIKAKPLEFKDGTFMVKRTPKFLPDDRAKALKKKRQERLVTNKSDAAKRYHFENPYIDKLVNGETPLDVQARGDWGFKGDEKLGKNQLNPKAIRQRHINNTYYEPELYGKWHENEKGEYNEPKDSSRNIVTKAKAASPRRISKDELREMVKESIRRMLMENAIETKKVQFEDGAELTVELYTTHTRNNTCEIAHGYLQTPDGNFESEGKYCFMNRSWQSFDYQKAMEKMIGNLPERYQRESAKQLIANELWECFMKRNKKYIQEGAYGYPDTIDTILLLSENDRECYNMYSQIAKAVNKIYKRDAKVTFERLVDSSVMKKYQQMCFRKFGKEQPDVNRTESPKRFRAYVAKKMIDEVLNGQWEERGEINKTINKSLNENNENQSGCYLDVYFAFELNGSNQYRKKGIGFEVVYRSDDGFTDTLAHYECYSHDDLSKPQFITTVQTDNFDIKDKEKIWKALDCGKNKEYSYNYEDEPEKVFKYKKCDIKPFVVANMDDAIKRFMSSSKPEWKKRGLNDFLNNNVINESQ